MSNLCKIFQLPYSFHKHPCCFILPSLLSKFCDQIFENILFFLDLLVQKIFFDKNHWFQLFSTKNDWIISLFLISVTLHCLLAISSCLLFAKKTSFGFLWKLYCYPHLTGKNFVFRFVLCVSFVFLVIYV